MGLKARGFRVGMKRIFHRIDASDAHEPDAPCAECDRIRAQPGRPYYVVAVDRSKGIITLGDLPPEKP